MDSPARALAMCGRPILYGLVLYACLPGNEKTAQAVPRREAPPVTAPPLGLQTGGRELWLRELGLTEREIEICLLICDERLPNRKIGDRLYISEATVKKHTNNIYRKLSVGDREGLRDLVKGTALERQGDNFD